MPFILSSIICIVWLYQILADITLNLFSYLCLLIINMPFVIKIVACKTSSWVFILHMKKWNAHNYIKYHLPRQMIPDITLNLATCTFWLSLNLLSKFAHRKRVHGYLFSTGSYLMHFNISSIICHVRWYQMCPDITLHLVSYLYLLIINLPFNFKIVAYKRVAGYLFC